MDFVRNPFNYVASKDRLLADITGRLDYTKNRFFDLFCGSGVVGVNVGDKYEHIIMNDGCPQMIDLLSYMREHTVEELLCEADKYRSMFHLSKTNKEGYLKAREYYNKGNKNPMLLYMLITHAFSYNVVFNSRGGFSVPSGVNRSYFNPTLRNKFINFCNKLREIHDIQFMQLKLNELVNCSKEWVWEDVMVYVDPPYSTSDASCSRSYGLKWTKEHDKILMNFLDYISDKGASFMMSNAFKNNGYKNEELIAWSEKYNTEHLACDYNNCHHLRKNAGDTDEVIIYNY